ncbi:hypothetical protein ANCCAN_21783 [Ancylostoma caninum]|uniref:Tc1-like transposase DDE domain-containing protein n=1 Tax=Ancylostoma caninum TaxID=29170 RepID=A0A368FJR4_ANCCA|nr:hypothetical protein ANCCAN_21783 [Ancylostoma caninum]
MEWLTCSPDATPMENLWDILVREIYSQGRTFSNTAELKAAITNAWSQVDHEILERLVNSMPHRIFEIISKHGGPIRD